MTAGSSARLDGAPGTRDATLLDAARNAVARALDRGADDAEAYVEAAVGTTLRRHAGALEWVRSTDSRGVGLRVIAGERLGYAYGSDLSADGVAFLVDAAVANAAVTDPDPLLELPPPGRGDAPALALAEPALTAVDVAAKEERLTAAEAAAFGRSADVRSISVAQYGDERKRIAIANSRGLAGAYETTFVYVMLEAIAERDGDVQAGQGFAHARGLAGLDAAAAGVEAAERAVTQLGAVPAPSEASAVVLGPLAAAQLLGQAARLFSGDAAVRDRTILAPLLGEAVAHARVSLVDDPLDPAGPGSRPFDGEGVTSRRTELVERGVLRRFAHNQWTGTVSGAGSTGNAYRSSYRGSPEVGFSNFVFVGDETPAGELLARAGEGVYVDELQSVHNVSALTGRFSVGFVGRRIAEGELREPLRDGTIAADFAETLKRIAASGDDFRFLPGAPAVGAPSLYVEELAVAGG